MNIWLRLFGSGGLDPELALTIDVDVIGAGGRANDVVVLGAVIGEGDDAGIGDFPVGGLVDFVVAKPFVAVGDFEFVAFGKGEA